MPFSDKRRDDGEGRGVEENTFHEGLTTVTHNGYRVLNLFPV